MALADILRAMEQQAQAEIARLQAQAESEAAAIVAKAEEEAKAIRARHLAAIQPRSQQDIARLWSEANVEARRALLLARETLLEEAFTAAQQELERWRERADYPRCLGVLLREAVADLGDEVALSVDPRDEAVVRRLVAELGISARIVCGLHTAGGVQASTPDGRITVVNTLEARLQRSRRHLRRTLAAILKGEDVSWKATMATPTLASEP